MAEKVLFESQSLYFSYNTAFGVYVSVDNPPPFSLALGEKYQVVWDETEYEVTAIDTSAVMPNTVGAGNGAAWGYAGNNEPFVILYTEGSDISFISLTDTAPNTHTVSVYQMVEDVVVEDAVLYTVSSTSLKKVADAIREKSGSADPIAFPDGFVQKISSISGGGGGSSADVRYVTFMNGDTVLYKKPVAVGDDCVDVLTKGLISTPTKESDAQYNYTYYGWGATDNGAADANILKNITEDKKVYAIYTATIRSYTITYLDDDGVTVLHTQQVAYGTVPSHTPSGKDGYHFVGWIPEPTSVTGVASYVAKWKEIVGEPFGANCTYSLRDGVLTIDGAGAMPTYTTSTYTQRPWEGNTVTSVVISDGVTNIGNCVFYKMSAITSVDIADSVTSIGEYAFCNCSNLENVTIPDRTTNLGRYAFRNCSKLTSITIPASVTTFGAGAFQSAGLTSVTLQDGVTKIGHSMFYSCNKLANITIPDSVTSINNEAFSGCRALTSITIPGSVTDVNSSLFLNCSELTSVVIQNGVPKISSNMFSGCTKLANIAIPASVTNIDSYAFRNCTALNSATFEDADGWYVSTSSTATSGTNLTLTDPTQNATYLANTYYTYYWINT